MPVKEWTCQGGESQQAKDEASFFNVWCGNMVSLESQLCWMVFCWGKHVKKCFPEVDTGERLRQTHEGMFCWSRHRRKDVLLKQACGRTWNEGFFVNNMHVSELHGNAPKNFWWCAAVSCYFLTQADWQNDVSWDRLTCWGKTCAEARPTEDTWYLEGYK